MTEIRPIRESEAESFLDLLCQVFDLDFARAKSIFFTEPLFDLSRKWALIDGNKIVSILTTVPLEFGWGRSIGIAGVATAAERQGEGLAAKLLERVIKESEQVGEKGVLLFARDTRLYERVGFHVLDEVLRGPIDSDPEVEVPRCLDFDEVRLIYDRWAHSSPQRLRRDELRWKYWKWNLRVSTPIQDGYLCFEGGVIREVVTCEAALDWQLPPGTEWFGLASMSAAAGVRLLSSTMDLYLMGRGIPALPEFFMTDQF